MICWSSHAELNELGVVSHLTALRNELIRGNVPPPQSHPKLDCQPYGFDQPLAASRRFKLACGFGINYGPGGYQTSEAGATFAANTSTKLRQSGTRNISN